MNRRNTFLAALALFALALGVGFTPSSSAVVANNPSATGNGQIEFENKTSTFSFNAVQLKNGTAKGHIEYHQRSAVNPANEIRVHVEVNCLRVAGNKATLSGVITKAKPASVDIGGGQQFNLVGAYASINVTDNGEGNNAPPDTASSLFVTDVPIDCRTFTFVEEFTTTNVQVRP